MNGWAPTAVVSNPMVPENRSLADYCADRHPGLDLHCFVPDPPTTKGEGRELRRLAAQYGWRTVIVVTFRPHISRARFILEQCFDGDFVMVGESDTRLCSQVGLRTSTRTLRAALQPGC